jgi:hypothetical protein
MSRNIPYQVESAQALLKTVGTIGAIFNRNAACTTNNASLNSALLCQTILPNTAGIFVETFRSDPKDYPNIINVDHHQITLTDSGALITSMARSPIFAAIAMTRVPSGNSLLTA